MSGWCVYILRCADGSLYTGVTVDVDRRLREHNGELPGGARYTASRRPVTLAHVETAANRASVCQREAAIKRLSRVAKLTLIERTATHAPSH